ncbi:MAG: transglutaminase family protein [Desulfobacterales bacterium]|jgi:transglutaminase-like putative cysteine protease
MMSFNSDPNSANHLKETYFCDYNHEAIQSIANDFAQATKDPIELTKNIFMFVRDKIIFGGDHWQMKASETIKKGYGACWNKNLILIALLRYYKIPSRLKANPMKNDFMKPAMGAAYLTVSSPFYHCFTEVYLDGRWIAIDPTLDKNTYHTFFMPRNVDWGIDWNGLDDMLLYTESIMGPAESYTDIDRALTFNLDSHFLFKYESRLILDVWLKLGNKKMWRKTDNDTFLCRKKQNHSNLALE